MLYRLEKDIITNEPLPYVSCVTDNSTIPFAPANTGYQKFKSDVLAGAELQDADGNVMTQEQAEAYIKELP